ncbi:WD repeat-containing protein 47 [Phytophthora boehmeriae]|uniref:WD repeat-containing protein 47 n=1 Tax=Phytophthora boehmeriae TaxID=109152 RepID=A0A8T1WN24_9STRA|nr:WD repeat-containing protein 47 [Phytophthora boehmeriae]
MTVPCHADVLFLIVQYLQAMGLYSSSLVLQQESGVDVTWLRGVSHELALLRRWVFAGDVKRARALLKPLQSLDVVPNELVDARLALDELDVLLMKPQRDQDQSRLAQAKLKCFEKLVLLFRAPVGETESNVFKYVAMPKLQLVGLVRDAVLFHCQNSNATAKDCISVKCTVNGIDVVEVENMASLLFLDKPGGKNEHVPISSKPLTQSVDWSNKLHRRPHNPMAQSVSLSQTRWQEDNGEMEAMHNSHEGTESVKTKETADAAVGTEIMVADVAVGSEIMVADVAVGSEIKTIDASVGSEIETASVAVGSKVATADVAVDCVPEAVDIAVSCEPENGNEATTQTDLIALNQAEPEVHTVLKDLKDVDREDNQLQAPTKIDDTGGGNEEAGLGKQDNVPTQSDGSQQEHIMKDQEQVATASNTSGQRQETTIKETSALDQTAAVGISTSSSGNSVVQQTLKTSQKPVVSEPEILENPSKTTQLEQQDDIVRDIETPDQTGSGLLAEVLHVDNDASVGEKIPLHKSAPKHYSELMLDDISIGATSAPTIMVAISSSFVTVAPRFA